MEIFEQLGAGLGYVLGWQPLLAILIGTAVGILVGAMPGLSPSMGVALLVPFTYGMPPPLALVFLTTVYLASSYGGSITAITINTPGTASAVVTGLDGYPLARAGEAGRALGISLVASVAAGIIGTLVLIFFSIPLSAIAVKFHPSEYFALAIFGLATVASMAGQQWAKAFLMALLGLLINTVGTDPISGHDRFTFGVTELSDGFVLIPALIGLFALSEIFHSIERGDLKVTEAKLGSIRWPGWVNYWKLRGVIFWNSLLGTLVGIFPGAGATIAAFISYDLTKRFSKNPEKFGKGSEEGIAAAEAANSSSVAGAMVPLLTLGIPGSATTAVLIGAMMIHKLNPGPQLFTSRPDVIYGIFAGLLAANLVLLGVGLLGSRLWVRVADIRKEILFVFILAMAVLGSYAVRTSLFDVACCVGFGLLGWVLKRRQYPLAPIILGMVLGGIAETNFRRAVIMDGFEVFAIRPVTLILLILALASFAIPLWAMRRGEKKSTTRKKSASSVKKTEGSGLDIVGDVHGHETLLRALLTQCDYRCDSTGAWSHPEGRRLVFVGDFINRGPEIPGAVRLCRELHQQGLAEAVMGNHDFHALEYHYLAPHHPRDRILSPKHQAHLQTSLKAFQNLKAEWEQTLIWLQSLPLFLDKGHLRIVHACWDTKAIDLVRRTGAQLTAEDFLQPDPVRLRAIKLLFNGPKTTDPVTGQSGRTQWWRTWPVTRADAFYPAVATQDGTLEWPKNTADAFPGYPDDAPPVIFGHYGFRKPASPLRANVACVDLGVAVGGPLAAYRWSGETVLRAQHFVIISNPGNTQ